MSDSPNFELAPIKQEGATVPYSEDTEYDEYLREKRADPPKITTLKDWDYKPTPTTEYMCECFGTSFSVHYKYGGYETSVKCNGCQKSYIVHEG